ncbi:hypothetical protein [Nocardia sp. NPDC004860]|uniref:hypothetical protein n=1 Tax=Nocardia sp. NPDC004860 TaxID=3154557 RepID=UPI0033A63A02
MVGVEAVQHGQVVGGRIAPVPRANLFVDRDVSELRVYPGAPHGIFGAYRTALETDLLAFLNS